MSGDTPGNQASQSGQPDSGGSSSLPHGRRFRISGKVQGVWFRESTRQQAMRLGLMGHAKNLPDGSVEVLAMGSDSALAELAAWLHRGPPLARVEQVEEHAAEMQPMKGFQTL